MHNRWKRRWRRMAWIFGVGSLLMAVFALGRLSADPGHWWVQTACIAVWFGNAAFQFIQLHRESSREDREFKREMRGITEQLRRQR